MLPRLYQVSSQLQALAITTGYLSPNAVADQSLLTVLPLVTTACVEVSVVEEYEQFRRNVGGPEGALAVVDAFSNCIWTSTEFLANRSAINDGMVDLPSLEASITEALGGKQDDVVMSFG